MYGKHNIGDKMIISKSQNIHRHNPDTIHELADNDYLLKNIIGCTYVTYMREDFDRSEIFYYSSNPKWQEIFIGNNLINHCAICATGSKIIEKNATKGMLPLVWDMINHNITQDSQEINQLRESHNIAHGIGIVMVSSNIRESISFAGAKNDLDFYKRILSKSETIKQQFDLRTGVTHFDV